MYSKLIFYLLNIFLITFIPSFSIMMFTTLVFLCFCLIVELFPNFYKNAFTPNSQSLIWVYLKLFFPIYVYSYAERLYEDIIVIKALIILMAFYFIFFIGLNSTLSLKTHRFFPKLYFSNDKTSIKTKIIIVILLYCFSLLMLFFSKFLGINHFMGSEVSGGYLNILYTIFVDIKLYILVLLFYWCLNFKTYSLLLFLVFFEIIFAFFDGGRSAILKPFLLLLFVGTYLNNYLRTSFYGFINLFIAVLIIFAPFLTLFKESLYKTMVESAKSIIDLNILITTITKMQTEISNLLYYAYQTPFHFSGMFDGLQRVALKVPEVIAFQYGSTFLNSWIIGLVPRVLWPDKPVFTPGRYFSVVVFDHNSEIDEDGVSQGIGIISELYLNFGFVGLFIIFLIGVYLKFFWIRVKFYQIVEKNEISLLRWFFLVMQVSLVLQLNLSTFWLGTLREAIICYFFLFIITFSLPKIKL